MSNKKKETGRKKGLFQFFLLIVISGFAGGVSTYAALTNQKALVKFFHGINDQVESGAPLLLITVSVICCLVSTALVLSFKHAYLNWDGEDEEEAERIDKKSMRYQTAMEAMLILEMICSSIVVVSVSEENNVALYVISVGAVIFAILWCIISLDRMMKYVKEMNPEKKGNVISWSFNKEWLESCDEQEKQRLYRAGYYSYISAQYFYGAAYVGCIILSNILELGLLPFLLLGAAWLFQMLSFHYYYERGSRKSNTQTKHQDI